jgi:protoheme IX farnesyltransferase
MNEQYQAAGFRMLPSGGPDQSTAFQIVFYTLWTVVISLIPAFEYTGALYLTPTASLFVLVLGGLFLYSSVQLMILKTIVAARSLIRMSILYITGIQLIYVIDKFLLQ